jgi:uncharacterized protein (DUF305 family)
MSWEQANPERVVVPDKQNRSASMTQNITRIATGLALLALTMPALSQSSNSNSDQSALPDACRHVSGQQMAQGQAGMMGGGQGSMMGGGQGSMMQGGQGGMMGSTSGQGATGSVSPFAKEYIEAMAKMDAPMMMAITSDDPDLAFTCGMIPHHQGAVDMAKIQLKYGKDADAKKMAERVIKEQEGEIAELKTMAERLAKGRH